jgi:hypothetical protein
MRAGELKAVLPSSLIKLIESFLGTRAILAKRPVTPPPIVESWALDDLSIRVGESW